jgi:hypothetical protein
MGENQTDCCNLLKFTTPSIPKYFVLKDDKYFGDEGWWFKKFHETINPLCNAN